MQDTPYGRRPASQPYALGRRPMRVSVGPTQLFKVRPDTITGWNEPEKAPRGARTGARACQHPAIDFATLATCVVSAPGPPVENGHPMAGGPSNPSIANQAELVTAAPSS